MEISKNLIRSLTIITLVSLKWKFVENHYLIKKFLNIREKTKNKNIVLIFDECTTGFRQSFGGIHKTIKIYLIC